MYINAGLKILPFKCRNYTYTTFQKFGISKICFLFIQRVHSESIKNDIYNVTNNIYFK